MIRLTVDIAASEEDGAIKIQPQLTMTTFAPNDHETQIANYMYNAITKAFADIYYKMGALTEQASKQILEDLGVYDILNMDDHTKDDDNKNN